MQITNKEFLKQLYLVYLFNFILSLFISIAYINYLENIDDFLAKFYFVFTTIGHFALLSIIPLLFALLIFGITKSRIVSKVLFFVLSAFGVIILKLDANIFSQFRYHLSPIVFNLMFGKRASDTFQFSASNIAMALLFILLIIAAQFLFYFIAKKIVLKKTNLRIKTGAGIFIAALLISHLVYAWSSVNFYRPITQFKNVYPAFYPLTAESLMTKLGLVDAEQIKKNKAISKNLSQNTIHYPLNPIISNPQPIKKNILFIVIDSWRYDFMTPEITPNIYNFSLKSQQFLHHNSGSNMTTGGIFTLFYGMPATCFDSFTGIGKSPVFMNELQKQNYEMDIFASSTLENPPFNQNVFANIPNLRLSSKGKKASERDINITEEWMAKKEKYEGKNPFFGFLFFDSAHGFDYPKNYKTTFNPSLHEVDFLALNDSYNATPLINRYKNSLHFIDGQIGKIIAQLEDKKLLENTIIVITSDHGQEFNDNKKGYWQHGGNFSKYQIQVPMMVFDFSKAPKKYNHMTLHYDIVPTIMRSFLGTQNPLEEYSTGQDLYDPKERDWFVCGYNQKYSVIQKNKITTIYTSGLYDISDSKLNSLNEEMDYNVIEKALNMINKYYQKTADKK
ncbi:MAG: DUF3413 domain-containing protein [Bacteroidota bacterium]